MDGLAIRLRGDDRQGAIQFTQVRLYQVIVRNAGKWYRREHKRDWYGYLKKQIPEQTKRAVKEVRPHKGEEPWGGHDAGPDEDPVERLVDWRELPPDERVERDEYIAWLIDRLPPDQAEVWRLWYFDDKSYEEIAGQLCLPAKEVERLWKQGKNRLRRMMKDNRNDARAGL